MELITVVGLGLGTNLKKQPTKKECIQKILYLSCEAALRCMSLLLESAAINVPFLIRTMLSTCRKEVVQI